MNTLSRMTSALAVLTLLLGGCGLVGGGSDGSTEDTNAAATAALNSWLDAVAKGEGKKACALETPAFKKAALANSVQAHNVKAGATCEAVVTASVAVAKTHHIDLTNRAIKAGRKTPKHAVLNATFEDTEPASYYMTLGSDGWKVAQIFDDPT